MEQTVRKLIETAGRLVANRNVPGSGVTAPYGTIGDTGRVQISQETMTRTGASDTTLPTRSSKVPDRKIRVCQETYVEAQQSVHCASSGHWSRSFQASFCNSSECSNHRSEENF